MPNYRARPSLLGPVAAATGFSLGAAAGLLPTKLSHAITGRPMLSCFRPNTDHRCLLSGLGNIVSCAHQCILGLCRDKVFKTQPDMKLEASWKAAKQSTVQTQSIGCLVATHVHCNASVPMLHIDLMRSRRKQVNA